MRHVEGDKDLPFFVGGVPNAAEQVRRAKL